MLQPSRRKYRKEQKGRNTGLASRGTHVSFGEFGLKATGRGRLTARQIEAARRAINRHIKRGGRIWIRIFRNKPISQKPAEVRMGNGQGQPRSTGSPRSSRARCSTKWKGSVKNWRARRFRLAAAKLPISTTFVARHIGA
ncbi:50S ribosomal protein L16 [Bordetella pertussis]|nr:50S ribosomal protein L16 [Bordetella pertussis]